MSPFEGLGRRSLFKMASVAGVAVAGSNILTTQKAAAATISSPVEVGSRYTSGFRTSDRPTHAGSDYAPKVAGTTGRPIYAIADGQVVRAQWNALPYHSGIAVIVYHSALGRYSYYGHLASYKVSVGQNVRAGQHIAVMGTTGNSTGIHLHLGIFSGSLSSPSFVDPHAYLKARGVTPGVTAPVSSSAKWPYADLPVLGYHTTDSHNAWVKLMYDIGYRNSSLAVSLQSWLKAKGYYGGVIDGQFGSMSVKALQSLLRDRGFYSGYIDGVRGEMTIKAEIRFLNDQRQYY